MLQKTIRNKITAQGFGIFTQKLVKMTIFPAPEDSGIVVNGIRVCLKNISPLPHRMSLRGILLPEHFLSACYGLGIDNLEVELTGKEFPFFDGSSKEYLSLLLRAGIKEQKRPAGLFSPKSPLIETLGSSFIALLPGKTLTAKIFVSFLGSEMGTFFAFHSLNPETYKSEIAWARTYGRYPSPSFLRRVGLSFQKRKGILYPKRLRSEDEPARHKALDLLGDLRVFGRYIHGEIFAYNPSHKLSYKLLTRISANDGYW